MLVLLQIYNESLYDLLDITTQPHEISIYESSRGVVTVSGLRSVTVGSEADALALLFEVGAGGEKAQTVLWKMEMARPGALVATSGAGVECSCHAQWACTTRSVRRQRVARMHIAGNRFSTRWHAPRMMRAWSPYQCRAGLASPPIPLQTGRDQPCHRGAPAQSRVLPLPLHLHHHHGAKANGGGGSLTPFRDTSDVGCTVNAQPRKQLQHPPDDSHTG